MLDSLIENIKTKLSELKESCIQRDLIVLGLTKTILKKYYPDPEVKKMKRDKFYYLYNVNRVREFLELDSFKADFAKTIVKSKRGIEASNKIKEKNVELVKQYEITVRKISIKQLKKDAIRAWENWNESVWDDSSEEHTKRIMMNFARHNLTYYDDILSCQKGMIGTWEMYEMLKDIVTKKILEIYPELEYEEND